MIHKLKKVPSELSGASGSSRTGICVPVALKVSVCLAAHLLAHEVTDYGDNKQDPEEYKQRDNAWYPENIRYGRDNDVINDDHNKPADNAAKSTTARGGENK
jgi:hypothetical protein